MKIYVKAVSKELSPKQFYGFSFIVGEEYFSKNGYCFCDTANATREYFKNPLETRYLEVLPLSEIISLGDNYHSFTANHIKIIREIPIDELREDFYFNRSCEYFEE